MVFRLEKITSKNRLRNSKLSKKIGKRFEVDRKTAYGKKQEWLFEDGTTYKTSELIEQGFVKVKDTEEGAEVILMMKDEVYELTYLRNTSLKMEVVEQLSII